MVVVVIRRPGGEGGEGCSMGRGFTGGSEMRGTGSVIKSASQPVSHRPSCFVFPSCSWNLHKFECGR